MGRTQTMKKGGVLSETGRKGAVLCETVGSGNWTVRIWREECRGEQAEYRLVLNHEAHEGDGSGSCLFSAADMLELPKLVQVLCSALINDGWLRQELKDDLACLGHVLDAVIGDDKWESRKRKTLGW